MALTIKQQYDIGAGAITTGDIDLLSRLLTDPSTITIKQQRTVAEKLGFKNGFLKAAVNTAADPLVWIAAFMSRKFPTQAWLKGTVPQRFVGAANEFSGVSLLARPSEAAFRGTNIPKLNALSLRRQAEVMRAGKKMLSVMDRPNWAEEMPIVSLMLEGASPAGATPELQQVAKQVRSGMNSLWDDFLSKTQKIEGGLNTGTKAVARDFTSTEAPKFLRDYLPHIPLTGNESTVTLSGREALERLGGRLGRNVKNMLETKGTSVGDVWTEDAQGRLVSHFNKFQAFAQGPGPNVYNQHLFRRQRQGIKLETPIGQDLFYTDLNLVLQKYVASTARTYSLNAPLTQTERAITSIVDEFGVTKRPTADPIIAQVMNQGIDATGARLVRKPIKKLNPSDPDRFSESIEPGSAQLPTMRMLESLVKAMRGSASEDQMLLAPLFNQVHNKLNQLRNKGTITAEQANQMAGSVGTLERHKSFRRKVDALTNYLYVTTLGLNPMSAIRNMFQPVITTAPAIGIGPTVAGIKEFAPRAKRLASDIAGEMRNLPVNQKGLPRLVSAANRAFEKNFPELVSHRLDIDPRLYDVSDDIIKQTVTRNGKFIDKDSFFKFLMGPFMTSEFSNRAISFYGARGAIRNAMRTGEFPVPKRPDGKSLSDIEINELLNFEAANVVNATQFRPGPGARSVAQSVLPSPLRQFSGFTTRLLSFFGDSTVRGATTQAQLQEMNGLSGVLGRATGGRNLGTLARATLYGKIAANGFRDVLGIDIAESVGLGTAVPFVPENQPFAPLPIPPFPGAIMATVSAFANRDIKELSPMVLPGGITIPIPKTLFPGGIGLSRMFRAMNQWRPDLGGIVDDDERLLFKSDAPDAILQMLGVPLEKMRRERRSLERLHANRQVSRDLGRKYRLAASNFDFKGMDNVQKQYGAAFPDMPPITVSSRELARFNDSRRITRVQRMIRTLPASFRTMESDIFDMDQDLIAGPAPAGLRPLAPVN